MNSEVWDLMTLATALKIICYAVETTIDDNELESLCYSGSGCETIFLLCMLHRIILCCKEELDVDYECRSYLAQKGSKRWLAQTTT